MPISMDADTELRLHGGMKSDGHRLLAEAAYLRPRENVKSSHATSVPPAANAAASIA